MSREQLAFYVHHETASDGSGMWVGTCPTFPRMEYWSPQPSKALAGIRRFSFQKADLEMNA